MSNADPFLDAFAAIERHLRRLTKQPNGTPFFQVVDEASKRSAVVRPYGDDLKEYAELRNAIVHDRRGGQVIAEPLEVAVKDLTKLKELITQPPTVFPAFRANVIVLSPSAPVSDALKPMVEHSFSQVPVKDGETWIGLLTANTVTRWLGANLDDPAVAKATPIRDVLSHTEYPDNHAFVGREAPLTEVVQRFHDHERMGKRLDAVLITQNGRQPERLLGIITVSDLPRVWAMISK
jgi:CBS domain-containing protein